MGFTNDDVERLIRLLDASHFDELQLEAEGLKLSLRRHGAGAAPVPVAPPTLPAAPPSAAAGAASAASAAGPAAPAVVPPPAASAGLLEIRAPMLGTFYGAPKPGAAPFVMPGSRVGPDTVVAVIEVMKLMNSIAAGVDGEVVEVAVRDGELVEFDQPLMRVRPA